jgi:hypothetical protein
MCLPQSAKYCVTTGTSAQVAAVMLDTVDTESLWEESALSSAASPPSDKPAKFGMQNSGLLCVSLAVLVHNP